MKKQFFNPASVKRITAALFTSIILFSSSANAAEKTDTARQSMFTYTGTKDDLCAFNVSFENLLDQNFTLELTDENDHLLYLKKFSGKDFSKTIYVKNIAEDNQFKINFILKAGKNVFRNAFNVNTTQVYVRDMVVTRL